MATALITGSTSGIGKDLAELFAWHQYDLVLVARNKEVLQQMAVDLEERYRIKANYFDVDLSVPNNALQLYYLVKDINVNIDVLINNAGVGMYGECCNMEVEKVAAMLTLNMISLTELTLLFAKDMKQKGKGKILNVASTAAFQPAPYLAAYAASKAYVLSFTEALHIELKKYGIGVSAVCPGATHTNFAKQANMESSRLFAYGVMGSKEVAAKAFHGLMKNKMTIVTGWKNKFLVESVRFAPRKWVAMIAERMMR